VILDFTTSNFLNAGRIQEQFELCEIPLSGVRGISEAPTMSKLSKKSLR